MSKDSKEPKGTSGMRATDPAVTGPAAEPAIAPAGGPKKMSAKEYEDHLGQLYVELVKWQEWIRHEGLKVVAIFEGRDAAGKGGAIKRITEPLNPRYARVIALPAPGERERSQWYFQRYVSHLPAGGEIRSGHTRRHPG